MLNKCQVLLCANLLTCITLRFDDMTETFPTGSELIGRLAIIHTYFDSFPQDSA